MKQKSLPAAFMSRMKHMLGEEYPDFEECYVQGPNYGLRVNTRKITPAEMAGKLPFPVEQIPWAHSGFYYPAAQRPAQLPWYPCGLYYIQEPSAMAPASLLPVSPGDRVLDLCAAPGGKATCLGEKLGGEGLLVANDSSVSRARALLRNLELSGADNILVTAETPRRLADCFPGYFDRILVDAPCSGEGMFRRDRAVADAWTPDKPERCAAIQREILSCAAAMLAPGGLLMYSTCTFSPTEDEGVVSWLLESRPELELLELPSYPGFDRGVPDWGNGNPDLEKAIRIWPHHVRGEGHFMALFRNRGERSLRRESGSVRLRREDRELLGNFLSDYQGEIPWRFVEVRGQKAYLLPSACPDCRGLHFLRYGLYLGELRKNRFEPSQPLALSSGFGSYAFRLRLSPDDGRIAAYLRGETLEVGAGESARTKGWILVCVDEYPVGWGHLVNGILKNKYPFGWRRL